MSKATILRDTAKGKPCFVRLPGVCNHNPETTVLAHLNGGGMGDKHDDIFGAFACSECHRILDGGKSIFNRDYLEYAHKDAMQRTQQWWLDHGYIQIVKAPQPKLQKILPRNGFA